jgi:4-aminobutyrate aminotransferase-like enzyme
MKSAGEVSSDPKEDVLWHVIEIIAYFEARLAQMRCDCPTTIRIKGWGIRMKDPDYAANLEDKCVQAGLLFSVENDVLKLFPPLTVEQETTREGLDILEACL